MSPISIAALVRDNGEEFIQALEVGWQARSDRALRFSFWGDTHGERRLEGGIFLVVSRRFCLHSRRSLLLIIVVLSPQFLCDPIFLLRGGLVPGHLEHLLHLITAKFVRVQHSLKAHWFHHLTLHSRVILRVRRCLPVKSPELHHHVRREARDFLGTRPLGVTAKRVGVLFQFSSEGQLNTLSEVGDIHLRRGVGSSLNVTDKLPV
mmetsp:Transcript_32662/g.62432  ORF Transcript_32662/g.62432 Transcript_32662/m.62432 type:complete len:206 (-) Transcript_32662:954-1571(-)